MNRISISYTLKYQLSFATNYKWSEDKICFNMTTNTFYIGEVIAICEKIISELRAMAIEVGTSSESVRVCPNCNGLGYLVNGIYTPECKECNGTGQT